MSSALILIIDICVAMVLIAVANILIFDAPATVLLIPLAVAVVIAVIWLVHKILERVNRGSENSKKH